MNRRLFVGNLSYQATEHDLRDLFSQVGRIIAMSVPLDHVSQNKHRGFAFVEYSTVQEAERAIEQFAGTELCGRSLQVNFARQKDADPRQRDRGHTRSGARESRW